MMDLTSTEKGLRWEMSRRSRTRNKGAVCYEYELNGGQIREVSDR